MFSSPSKPSHQQAGFTLWNLVVYFLKLGLTGFGGPIALIGYMQRDLVESRRWFSREDYLHGVALAQMVPGPLAMQLAIYFGYLKGRILGATLVAVSFILAPFIIILAFSVFYLKYKNLAWVHAMLYGMGASVLGVVAISAWKLAKTSLEKDAGCWTIAVIITITTCYFNKVHLLFFLLAGLAAVLIYFLPKQRLNSFEPMTLFFVFSKAALVVYGGGMAVIAFLYNDVVHVHQWLTETEFVDAVAIGTLTPGPLLISAGFIGYIAAGFIGSLFSVVGIFLPVYLCVVLFVPFFKRLIKIKAVEIFIRGVTAAASGAIAGSVYLLGKHVVVDFWTLGLGVIVFAALIKTKIPVPILLLAGGLAGVGIKLF